MADFSISQFKQYVQNVINAAKIDDGNGIIEAKNGELAKVLSNFGIKESQIGDLLEKTDSSQTAATVSSNETPEPADVHKQFIEAQKKYDKMSEEQKYNIRQETIKQAVSNFDELQNVINFQKKLDILTDVPNFNNIDNAQIKEWVTQKVLTFAHKAQKEMSENIEKYDNAFKNYDATYCSPYEVKQAGNILTPLVNNIVDLCMLKVTSKIQEFLAINPDSMSRDEYANAALEMYVYVDSMVRATNENIERNAQRKFEQYSQQFENSMYALENDIVRQWIPPLDDTSHEEEPDTIAIEGAPIEKTFTDVVNNTTTGIKDAQNDNPQPDGKFIKDGKIYIRKNGQVYDLNGHKVQEN